MDLVFRSSPGHWEVAWTWMPNFLAMDRNLVNYVTDRMTTEFKGKTYLPDTLEGESLVREMEDRVLALICSFYRIDGLKEYLEGVKKVTFSSTDILSETLADAAKGLTHESSSEITSTKTRETNKEIGEATAV